MERNIHNKKIELNNEYHDDYPDEVPYDDDDFGSIFDDAVPTSSLQKALKNMAENQNNNKHEKAMGEISKYQQWQVASKGVYQAMGKVITHKTLPSGYYSLSIDNKGNIFANTKDFIYDDYIDLPIPEFKEILADINKFWEIKDKFSEYGFVFKRGILIHGKQGLGKSFLINGIIKDLIDIRNGLVFSLFNYRDLQIFHSFFREQLRIIEPQRPVVVVIEDIDGLCMDKSTETELINLLDGVEHSDNVIYLATTNHVSMLEERITNRPSRFDRRYHIKAPDEEVRRVFIEKKMKEKDLEKIDVEEWVRKTDGFNLAHIKELIISVVLYENTLEYAIDHLNKMREKPEEEASFSSGSKRVGFGG